MSEIFLKHKDEFRQLLDNYQISPEASQRLQQMDMVVLSGAAASGRNAIINQLVKSGEYYFIISDTTRPPKVRDGKLEQNGVNYYFRDEESVLEDIKAGDFIEAELIHEQQVSGTSVREVVRATSQGKIALTEVEYQGANNIATAHPSATMIGLLPPSYDEWIRHLTTREDISDEEFRRRLVTAEKVLRNLLDKPYFKLVVNDTIEQAADEIRDMVEHGHVDESKQADNRQITESILRKVSLELQR